MKRMSLFLTEADEKKLLLIEKHIEEKKAKKENARNLPAAFSNETFESQSPVKTNLRSNNDQISEVSSNKESGMSEMEMSEQEHYDEEEFQKIMMSKMKGLVDVITLMRNTINQNAAI